MSNRGEIVKDWPSHNLMSGVVPVWPIPFALFNAVGFVGYPRLWFDGNDAETRWAFYLQSQWKWRRHHELEDLEGRGPMIRGEWP